METTLEVLTTRKSGREVHRHWPDEVKAQIVSEPPIKKASRPEIIVGSVTIRLEEGASVARIAAVVRACAVPA